MVRHGKTDEFFDWDEFFFSLKTNAYRYPKRILKIISHVIQILEVLNLYQVSNSMWKSIA